MASDIPIEDAHILGFGFAMLLYGTYICFFAVTIRLLSVQRTRNRVVLCTMLGLFLVTTASLVLSIIDNYNGWIRYREVPGTHAYFTKTTNGIKVTKDLLLLAAALMADGLICWRLYVIWSKTYWILVVPGFLLLSEAAVGSLVISLEYYELWAQDGRFETIFRVGPYFICIASAVVNMLVTGLIVGRLWVVGREVQDMTDRNKYTRVIRALIESGFLYTLTIFVYFIAVISGLNGVFRLVDYLQTVIVAIAPTLIVLLLNYAGKSITNPSVAEVGRHSTTMHFSPATDTSIHGVPDFDPELPLPSSPLPFPTSSPPPKSPSPNPYQIAFHPSSSSSLTVHKTPSSSKPRTRLRTSSSQPAFPLGLGYSEVSLPPESTIGHMTIRESWQGHDLRGIEIAEGNSPHHSEDHGVTEPEIELLPPLPMPTSPIRLTSASTPRLTSPSTSTLHPPRLSSPSALRLTSPSTARFSTASTPTHSPPPPTAYRSSRFRTMSSPESVEMSRMG